MPSSGIAIVPSDLRSQFLDGLHPSHRKTILSAATPRRFAANSVATNQGHPADNFFSADKGQRQIFLCNERWQEASFALAWTRRRFRWSDGLIEPFFLSRQHRNDNGQLSVGVGPHRNPKPRRKVSQIARKRIVNGLRLCYMACHRPHRVGLPHRATAGCPSADYAWPYDWQRNAGWYCPRYHQ